MDTRETRSGTHATASRPATRSASKQKAPEEPPSAKRRKQAASEASPVAAAPPAADTTHRHRRAAAPPAAASPAPPARAKRPARATQKPSRSLRARTAREPEEPMADKSDSGDMEEGSLFGVEHSADEEDVPASSQDDDMGGMGDQHSALHDLLARLRGHGAMDSPLRQHILGLGGAGGRFGPMLDGLRATGQDSVQESALNDLAQNLLMGNEESLGGFRADVFVPVLHELLNTEHNAQLALLACRCLTNMLDAIPASSAVVASCIPSLCSKLLCIEYIDLAEQCLTTLSKLANEQGAALLKAGGLNAVLAYMDFFPTHLQRDAVSTAATICKHASPDSMSVVRDSLPILCNLLDLDKDKSMRESACLAFDRLVGGMRSSADAMALVAGSGVVGKLVAVLATSNAREKLFTSAIRVLSTLCRCCPSVAPTLFADGITMTIRTMLRGRDPSHLALQDLSSEQLLDAVTLISELLPALPPQLFYHQFATHKGVDAQWEWRDDHSSWHAYARRDSARIEAASQAGARNLPLMVHGQQYIIQIDNMQQVNRGSGNNRPIRRVEAGAAAALAGPDTRALFLQENPTVLQTLGQDLLGTLFDVYIATASQTVRRKVLEALLRLLAAAPSALLADLLRDLSVSAHITMMLATPDIRISAAALQVVQLLIEKLPDVFNVFFRRNGVLFRIHQMAKESESTAAAAAPASAATPAASASASTAATPSGPASLNLFARARSSARRRAERTPTDPFEAMASALGMAAGAAADGDSNSGASQGKDAELAASLAQHAAKLFETSFGQAASKYDPLLDPHPAMNDLRKLQSIASMMQASSITADDIKVLDSLGECLAAAAAPTSFEAGQSGLYPALLKFLTMESPRRLERLQLFVRHVAIHPGAVAALVDAVHGSMSSSPIFTVKDHRNRTREASALSSAIKLRLERQPGDSSLRELSSRTVLIEPLASVQAIEDFLWSRVQPQDSSRTRRGIQIDDGESASASEDDLLSRSPGMALDADDSRGDVLDVRPTSAASGEQRGGANATDRVLATAIGGHRLTLTLNDQILSPSITILQAVRNFAPQSQQQAPAPEVEFGTTPLPDLMLAHLNGSQSYTIYYRPWRPSDDIRLAADGAAASAAVPDAAGHPFEHAMLPPSDALASPDPVVAMMCLLRVLNTLARQPVLLMGKVDEAISLPAPAAFINQTLTSKLTRQVSDFDSICHGTQPEWCRNLVRICPFVLPFESRLLFLHYTAFGPARALQRLKAETTGAADEDPARSDRRRLSRTKLRISRERVLESAVQAMRDVGTSSSVLEFEFSNEHGTGLGPTLEFYALVSRELQKSSLGLWRSGSLLAEDADVPEYTFNPEGLFPRPGAPSSAALKHFDMLGRLMARAVMDNRLLDISFARPFYVWLCGRKDELGLADLETLDGALHRSLKPLQQLREQYEALLKAGDTSAIAALTLDGVAVEDLCLTFTLPGYPDVALVAGGADAVVTLARLGEYIDRVVAVTLVEGVQAQMAAMCAGFESVVPRQQLAVFTPDELERVFCGLHYHPWEVSELLSACRLEHGYTADSNVIQWLYELMASFGAEDQRAFVSFVTGSPNLPIGGFRGLRPPLTVVPKARGEGADRELPSVMTCQNYLKLPEYSSRAVLAAKLRLALAEGQGSFLLS
eukprot:m.7767 g.7767  ORF g.7767 m.7767 type:complete len:1657 (+) comp2221_c0_seq1:146-5116(+)